MKPFKIPTALFTYNDMVPKMQTIVLSPYTLMQFKYKPTCFHLADSSRITVTWDHTIPQQKQHASRSSKIHQKRLWKVSHYLSSDS